MSINKIFKGLDLSTSSEKKNVDYSELLDLQLCDYSFSVVWTNGQICNLNYLSGNRPPSTIWQPIISAPVTDNDGEISQRIGYFTPGTSIGLSYGIQAIDAIPRLAVLIVNITNRVVMKIPAGDLYKNMARGEFWQNMITINLP